MGAGMEALPGSLRFFVVSVLFSACCSCACCSEIGRGRRWRSRSLLLYGSIYGGQCLCRYKQNQGNAVTLSVS